MQLGQCLGRLTGLCPENLTTVRISKYIISNRCGRHSICKILFFCRRMTRSNFADFCRLNGIDPRLDDPILNNLLFSCYSFEKVVLPQVPAADCEDTSGEQVAHHGIVGSPNVPSVCVFQDFSISLCHRFIIFIYFH